MAVTCLVKYSVTKHLTKRVYEIPKNETEILNNTFVEIERIYIV